MTNICTKVTVRKRPIKNGQVSLYLDYYPAVRHPKTGKPTRREYLGIYIYADPKDKFETEFNKDHAPQCRACQMSQNRSHHQRGIRISRPQPRQGEFS